MPDRRDEAVGRETPIVAYVIASALLWAVFMPVIEWVTGDLADVGTSAMTGAACGLAWGLAMFAFETWLRKRWSE